MRLFEFGDLDFTPKIYHINLRRYLIFYYKLFGYYQLWLPPLKEFLSKTSSRKYIEYCSGSGDLLPLMINKMTFKDKDPPQFLLSDLHPFPEFVTRINNKEGSQFHYIEESIDATKTYAKYNCPRIFINSFHHFPPELAKEVLVNSIRNKNDLIILEYVRNTFLGYCSMLAGSIGVLFTLPFVVRFKHLPILAFFTYIIPIFPLMFLWDGVVSCKHEYTAKNLKKILQEERLDVEISASIDRNLFYLAGVSSISFVCK